MRRRKLIARKSSPKVVRPKPVNRERKAREFARTYGSKARVAWVQSLPCVANTFYCGDASENAHIGGGGMGRKADYTKIVPLCRTHHIMLHTEGRRKFEERYGEHLAELAADIEDRWQSHLAESSQ